MKLVKDMSLNFLSAILLILVIQVIYFPIVASKVDVSTFGNYIFIYTFINFVGAIVGGVGNSLYMKYYSTFNYETKLVEFRKIQSGLLFMLIIIIPILYIILTERVSTFDYFIIILTIYFVIYRIYLTTWYRARLMYSKILYGNLVVFSVYLLLLYTELYVYNFYLTILISEFSFMLFIILFSKKITLILPMKFNNIYLKPFLIMTISFFAVTLFKYIDKWYIEFYFNPEYLTYFYIASITSTLFTIPFNTLSSVLFSYFIQSDQMSIKNILKVMMFVVLAPLVVISCGYIFGPIVINTLYKQYYDFAIPLFYILNIAFGFLTIDYVLRGFIIKFYPENTKMIIDLSMLVIMILSFIIFSEYYGLMGIAYAIFITYLIKALANLTLLIIYYKRSVDNERDKII